MPIYEYRCQSCGHELEKLQRMSDSALTDCPECGKSTLKRLISAAGFRLKGAGWYETDFKKTNQRNLVDSGSESGGKESGKDSGKDSGKESSKESAKESTKDTKSSDAGSSKAAEKPAKPGNSASSASS